jgi:hypothetical protein
MTISSPVSMAMASDLLLSAFALASPCVVRDTGRRSALLASSGPVRSDRSLMVVDRAKFMALIKNQLRFANTRDIHRVIGPHHAQRQVVQGLLVLANQRVERAGVARKALPDQNGVGGVRFLH